MGIGRNTPNGIHMPGSGAMLYTVEEAGALLRVSNRSVWRRIAEGRLAVVKLSDRGTRITGESLQAFMKSTAGTCRCGATLPRTHRRRPPS